MPPQTPDADTTTPDAVLAPPAPPETRAALSTTSPARRVLRAAMWGGPLLLWTGALFWGGAEGGRYETTWRWIHAALNALCPEFAPPDAGNGEISPNVSLYQLNGALRRLAHVVGYAVLAALAVRLIQRGEPRLKRSSVVAALVLGLLYSGLDELHRYLQPARHAKWLDVSLNFIGVFITITVTILYFQWKEWERRLSQDNSDPI